MRTLLIALTLAAVTACDGSATQAVAPEADAAAADRGPPPVIVNMRKEITRLQAELDALTADLDAASKEFNGHVTVLKAADTDLANQMGNLAKDFNGHVTVLKAAATDLGEGSCALARDAASGLPTGRRQHKPITYSSGTHSWGDPHETISGIATLGVDLVSVDEDGDGTPDYIAIETDLDGDGYSDYIELGGDRDGDGRMDDDAAEAKRAHDQAADQVCGATSHL